MKRVSSLELPMKLLILIVATTMTWASQDGIGANGYCLSEERFKNLSYAITEDTLVEMKKEFADLKGMVISLNQTVASLNNRISLLCNDKSEADSALPETDTALPETGTALPTERPITKRDFYYAARDGNLSIINAEISRLSSSGLDLNWQNKYGFTLVYAAAQNNQTAALEMLLASGGDPNIVPNDGISALSAASAGGLVEVARMLIQAGANLDYVRSQDGSTALHAAAYNNHPDVALLLLQNGADKNKRVNFGATAAKLARDYGGNASLAELIENY